MNAFLKFIEKSKEALNNWEDHKTIHLVLGNESCDLDSTVSATALAYLIHSQNVTEESQYVVIPVMNVEAKYFPLRTETCYLLNKYGIDSNQLVFKDQIEYSNLLKTCKVKTSLVDHHVLSSHDKVLEETVMQIFDHRTINHEEICQSKNIEKSIIKIVGSCSTLIATEIIDSKLPILFNELCHLLYATIIYDTIGLDEAAGKTFDEDISIARHLESICKPTEAGKDLFNLLWKIHNDTSSLGTKDLLYRDLKIVKGIPIPGLPMLVETYFERTDANDAVVQFVKENNTSSVVLIGIDASKEVKRDIGVYSTDSHFKDILVNVLHNTKQISGSDLLLTEISVKNKNVSCFRQGNIKLTRKFILPLVNEVATKYVKENLF